MAYTYNFKNVTVTVNGEIIVGFGEGDDVVSITRDDDGISTTTGAKGEVTTSKVANPVGTGSLTLQSQSPSNSTLNALAKSKESFSFQVTELNSQNFKCGGSECYVVKSADNTRGKNASERTWDIKITDLTMSE